MRGFYKFDFGARLFAKRVRRVSRSMTPDEEKAFDKVFAKMRETFTAMDEFFDVASSAGASPPRRSGTPNERGKRK